MGSVFLPVFQLQPSHPPWEQMPLHRDPLAPEDRSDQGSLALLPTDEEKQRRREATQGKEARVND